MKLFSFLLLLLIFFKVECSFSQNYNKKKKNIRPAIVEIGKVEYKSLNSYNNTVGNIITLSPYVIVSKLSEEVKNKYVLEGDKLKKGQIILELENKNIKRLIARFEEEVKYNKLTFKLIEEELFIVNKKINRFIKLMQKKVVSEQVLDDLFIKRISLNKQKAKINFDLKKLSFQLIASKEDLLSTKVFSPVEGNLINFNIEIGTILQKGQKIASILLEKQNEIETNIRSDLAPKIFLGSKVLIETEKNKNFFGKIRTIIGIENIKTGSRILRIKLPQNFPNEINIPGKKFKLKIPVGNEISRLIIDKDALIAEGLKKFVYVVKNNIAKKRQVFVGQSFENKIEVFSGLKNGDLVVVKGNENLRKNQPVKFKSKKKFYRKK